MSEKACQKPIEFKIEKNYNKNFAEIYGKQSLQIRPDKINENNKKITKTNHSKKQSKDLNQSPLKGRSFHTICYKLLSANKDEIILKKCINACKKKSEKVYIF